MKLLELTFQRNITIIVTTKWLQKHDNNKHKKKNNISSSTTTTTTTTTTYLVWTVPRYLWPINEPSMKAWPQRPAWTECSSASFTRPVASNISRSSTADWSGILTGLECTENPLVSWPPCSRHTGNRLIKRSAMSAPSNVWKLNIIIVIMLHKNSALFIGNLSKLRLYNKR